MKKMIFLLAVVIFALNANAQPPEGDATSGMTFGKQVDEKDALDVDKLGTVLVENEPTTVKVKGKVVEVCKAEGCWIKMETAQGPMLIKMKDHAFLVPLSLNGKTIITSGIAKLQETSVEMLRHYAEDAGKSKEEIAAITEPKKQIVIQAEGILVL